jgi:hypothetical protein
MIEYGARQPTKPRQLKVAEKPAAEGDRSRHKSIPYKIGKDTEEVKNNNPPAPASWANSQVSGPAVAQPEGKEYR